MSTEKQPSHSVQHSIETGGRHVTAKFRRLDPERLAAAKAKFNSMLKAGIIRRSSSQWNSPLHLVRKKDGSWRPCGDFRPLNLITTADKYPLPNMADFAARLGGCRVFSKLDLNKGYLQVPVAEADIPKTALITPFGLFEFVRMPFGLKNAGMTFQRMMDAIFADLPFVFIYLDNVLIASRTVEEHQHHLRLVFQLLSKNGLLLNVAKCVLAADSIDFLGHRITAAGIQPLPHRVAAINTFPQPRTVRDLQAFLGLFNFYRKFVPKAAAILKPLTDAMRGGVRDPQLVSWSAPRRAAFSAAKAALAAACRLDFPAHCAELSLVTDASATHAGAVLQQRRQGQQWRPLGFFSVKLDSPQQKYSAFDRELLAVFLAIRHFRFMLEGRQFVVFTDHRPLLGALG
jgi:Reverse transcriptase (RNA-dependent DNA polymerase)/RNase H-like domain found in reverse transcriptase